MRLTVLVILPIEELPFGNPQLLSPLLELEMFLVHPFREVLRQVIHISSMKRTTYPYAMPGVLGCQVEKNQKKTQSRNWASRLFGFSEISNGNGRGDTE